MSDRHRGEIDDDVAAGLATAALSLARGLAAGGTLWCWAPGSSHHAQHVAVEFVHPVVVGSRAVPAVAIPVVGADDAVDALRPLARAGDTLLVVGGDDQCVGPVLQRAVAWGVRALWMGCGPRPLAGRADHLLWVSDDASAAHDGRLTLGYHLLWELTQVCFEHPGLLDAPDQGTATCVTCADEGRLAEVVSSAGSDAVVRTAAGTETVSTRLVGPIGAGDLVLVHAGTAITVVPA